MKRNRKRKRKINNRDYTRGQQDALNIVNLFPLLVLRDKYGFGKKRLEEFIGHYLDVVNAYNDDYIQFQDVVNVLKEETGLDVSDFVR